MSSNDGFGLDTFGTSEFGSEPGATGFGESGFGEGGFGGVPDDYEWRGLFGSSPFGAEPFGGALIKIEEEEPVEEIPELPRSVHPQGAPSVRDRFEAHIKSPFQTDPGTTWDRLLNTIGDEFEQVHTARDDVILASYVDTAVGENLDKIGTFVQLPRKHDESDAHYRGRLKVQLRTLIGGGTIPDIKETAAILLNTDERAIEIYEDFDNESARFDISFPQSRLEDSPITIDDFVSFLDEIRAAGVRIFGELEGEFEHRSEQDFFDGVNDTSKGYNEGTYSGILIS